MKQLVIILLFLLPALAVCDDSNTQRDLSKKAIENGWKHVDEKPDVLAPTKHLDTALMHFYHAILLDKTSGPAWFATGYTYSIKGDADSALASYRKSLEFQPDYPSTHMNIGIILLVKGEMESSLTSLLKARDLAPERGAVYGNLARWYYTNKQISKAKSALALAYKYQSPKDEAFLKLLSKHINKASEK